MTTQHQNQGGPVVNRDFARLVQSVRQILPYLAVFLLIGVYITCAVTSGLFLGNLMTSIRFGGIISLSIGFAIQLTRGLLVFFPQLNPNRPVFNNVGEFVATLMGIVSIAEIVSLASASALHPAVAVSMSILMAAGVGVEIYLLQQIRFYTEMELYRNSAWWAQLQEFYRARRKFKSFVDNLEEEFSQPAAQSHNPLPAPAASSAAKNGQKPRGPVNPGASFSLDLEELGVSGNGNGSYGLNGSGNGAHL